MKNRIFLVALMSLTSMGVAAGTCGSGKILEVLEGGWDTDDFMIKIDYSVWASEHVNTEFNGYIVYKNTLNAQKYNGIKAIALSAFMAGKKVSVFSHVNNCSEATSIDIFN